ncbi:hypothetical protein NQK81_01875 [Amycolatopsis roodepoortensis]|uniref:hypothetical protein n=1 Tax=Amycolatopsis roodepoortensis TaxID=700274 RepID=UPI00214B52BB|nr:hypothetical protein [Amycolatopsis roodepoortensis]UUV32223.1 hypothetical protein NQK81_01875 [Amycolatopsis roodepoortensis]
MQLLLHSWAAHIASADYSDAVSLETLIEMWQHRPRAVKAAITGENTTVSAPNTPAWLPDDTWQQPHQQYSEHRQHHLGGFTASPPPKAPLSSPCPGNVSRRAHREHAAPTAIE